MDSVTIYEFLQEKSVTPTGPGSYSNSKEMSNALKTFKKNNSSKTKKNVNFYDYDGSLVDFYPAEKFLQLSEMPKNPSYEGLTAQGWNWSLADAKSYVADYGSLNIGQMYIPDDGKTRIHIKIEEGRLKPRLGLGVNSSAVIDWGDNSQTDTMAGSSLSTAVYQEHEYSAPGEYTISIAVTGEIAFLGDSTNGSQLLTKTDGNTNTNKVYLSSIKSVEVGSNVTSIGASAFYNCCALTNVTIPSGVTSIGQNTFQHCYSLTSITIPNGVTSIGASAFYNCCALTNVTIPSGVTSIGQNTFQYCDSLTNVTIPSGVTSIGQNTFLSCNGLGFIKFERSAPPAVAKVNAWFNIPTDCIIYVPQGSLSAYTSANNYPSSSTYTYIEY